MVNDEVSIDPAEKDHQLAILSSLLQPNGVQSTEDAQSQLKYWENKFFK